ncbi:MAG TPA: SGNH/GDSL hydrolase family protein [Ohtaekwangia sp.]
MKVSCIYFLSLLLCISNAPFDTEKNIHILFVGNSLTYANNLPLLVEEAAKGRGIKVTTEMLAYPNYALEDHWNDGVLQKKITGKKFQYVIVQQGPSSQADGRTMLLDYGQRIKNLCDKHNTKLVFFMVWPSRANSYTFDGVISNYTEAATKTGALLCPVGKIWKTHFEKTNDYSYYGPDEFHPSTAGSKVAADAIVEVVKYEDK